MQISGFYGTPPILSAIVQPPKSQAANTPPAVDPRQLSTELLTAFMNSPQARVDQTPLSAAGIGKQVAQGYLIGGRPAVGGAILTMSDQPDYLNTGELQDQSASGIASDLINTFGSNGSLSLSQVEQAYQVNDPSVSQGYRQNTKAVLEADWNVLSGGSPTMSASQLTAAVSKFVTDSSAAAPKQWGPVSSDAGNLLSPSQLAAAIQRFANAQNTGQEQTPSQPLDLSA